MNFKILLLLTAISFGSSLRANTRPNIIFMMSDDQAWNGLSVAMHPELSWSKSSLVETPNLEKLASQGMRFSTAYAPASVCSPTRISMQTGKSPAALHWTKAGPPEWDRKMLEPRNIRQLESSEVTFAELLQEAGYATAHYGKWHIEGGGPAAHGYDESDGNIGNEAAWQFEDPNPTDIFGMASRATKFMEKSKIQGKPFFLQMSWNALHAPQNAMKASLAKYSQKMNQPTDNRQVGLAALAEDLDTGVGQIMEAVERLGLRENTYVIYLSDNGAGGSRQRRRSTASGALAGGKGTLWEGGIRSPLIIQGPNVPPNSWCHERVVGYDFYPTFCELAQVSRSALPDSLEGGSIASLFDDGVGKVVRPRDEMVFHFPHYQRADGPHSCLYLNNFKLMKFYEDNRLALFDVEADIQEQNDLVNKMPAKVAELDQLLVTYLDDIKAQMAVNNREYDPTKATSPRRGSQRRGPGSRSR